MAVSVGVSSSELPPDVVQSGETSSSYPQVFETWDSVEDADEVAMTMDRDSPDVVNDSREVSDVWESAKTEMLDDVDETAVPMDKDSADVVDESKEEV